MKHARGEFDDINILLSECRLKGAKIDAYRGGIVLRTPLRTTIFYGGHEVDWALMDEIYDICRRDATALAEAHDRVKAQAAQERRAKKGGGA